MPHPTSGKSHKDYVAITYTDCGQHGRMQKLTKHYSCGSAFRQFLRIAYNNCHLNWNFWTKDNLARLLWEYHPEPGVSRSQILAAMRQSLEENLRTCLPHIRCLTLYDLECTCSRKELVSLLLNTAPNSKKAEPYRRIRRRQG
jgi:hypothetical protein